MHSSIGHPPILGIDTNSFGLHVVCSHKIFKTGTEPPAASYAWFQSKAKEPEHRRLEVFTEARAMFSSLPPQSAVFVEEPLVLQTNMKTTRALVMMGGVIEAAFFAANPDATWFWVNPSTWRKAVWGRGAGFGKGEAKRLAREHVLSLWRKQMTAQQWDTWTAAYDKQPDLYDAQCIMLYGALMLASGEVQIQ